MPAERVPMRDARPIIHSPEVFGRGCDADGRVKPDLVLASTSQEHGLITVRPNSGTKPANAPTFAPPPTMKKCRQLQSSRFFSGRFGPAANPPYLIGTAQRGYWTRS